MLLFLRKNTPDIPVLIFNPSTDNLLYYIYLK